MFHKLTTLLVLLSFFSLFHLAADDVNPIISVTSPPYCSDISGDTPINIVAPGMTTVTVKCWQAGGQFGTDATVGTVNLDPDGKGSIVFPADKYPHGPITVRILGQSGDKIDHCYLQLYNKSGAPWNEGMPKDAPPGADGMKLAFADDFSGPLSISSTDSKAKYYDHKPPNGSQDFSSIPFTSFDSPNNPFSQVDTYLRIRADAKKNSTGLISSLNNDASGIKVSEPCYFECRFIAPNAKGTWPAFWLMTDYMTDFKAGKGLNEPVDELDIIEAVGGEGPGEPNGTSDPKIGDLYQITPHAWNQPDIKDLQDKAYQDMHDPISMHKAGVPSTWYEAFHTYGCKITDTDTIYYLDNIEVARHPTLPTSKKYPIFFLINLATGSGWPVDLSRYNGLADMYVDYVRVYAQNP
jgi:beta-glucanase (GH16 family)